MIDPVTLFWMLVGAAVAGGVFSNVLSTSVLLLLEKRKEARAITARRLAPSPSFEEQERQKRAEDRDRLERDIIVAATASLAAIPEPDAWRADDIAAQAIALGERVAAAAIPLDAHPPGFPPVVLDPSEGVGHVG
jgi:hypothetical protein